MKIAIGCDEAAFDLKEEIVSYLKNKNIESFDFGVYDKSPSLYPDIANKVANEVKENNFDRGILLCGTGIGMCITANKVRGIRAAVCHDPYSAAKSRTSNNGQILCMGARVVAPELAKTILDVWIASEFQFGNSLEKVERIEYYENL